MTYEVHKQEPVAAKNRPWLVDAYNSELLDWVDDLKAGASDPEVAPSVVAMLQFRKQVGFHTPLTAAYLPPLQWAMDFFKRDTYNAGMYGSVNKFLNDLFVEGSKTGAILNPYQQLASSPAVWASVQWRQDEISKYGDKFLDLQQDTNHAQGLKVASGMAASGLATQEWLVGFWERYKRNVNRYSANPKVTPADWEMALPWLASAPNLPETVVREMVEQMVGAGVTYFSHEYVSRSLLWNETALTPEIYMEYFASGTPSLRKQGINAEPVPYHGTASLEVLRKVTGLPVNLNSQKWGSSYAYLSARFEQGAIWKKSLHKIGKTNSGLNYSPYNKVSKYWGNLGFGNWKNAQFVKADQFSDLLYLARDGQKLRDKLAEEQLEPAPWNASRVLGLPAVSWRLRNVRAAAASTGLDEDGNIPLEWLLELL